MTRNGSWRGRINSAGIAIAYLLAAALKRAQRETRIMVAAGCKQP